MHVFHVLVHSISFLASLQSHLAVQSRVCTPRAREALAACPGNDEMLLPLSNAAHGDIMMNEPTEPGAGAIAIANDDEETRRNETAGPNAPEFTCM
jgi:hypothetical protein